MPPGCRNVVEGGAAQRADQQLCPAGRSGVPSSKGAAGALLAVDLTTGRGQRSLEGLVRVHLAWLYVLHAHFKGDGVDYRHRQPESRRFPGWTHGGDRQGARRVVTIVEGRAYRAAPATLEDRLTGAAKWPATA